MDQPTFAAILAALDDIEGAQLRLRDTIERARIPADLGPAPPRRITIACDDAPVSVTMDAPALDRGR